MQRTPLCEIYSFRGGQDEVVSKFLTNTNADQNTIAYPNPVTDHIFLENAIGLKSLRIISVDGKEVDFIKNASELKSDRLDLSNLDSGMFLLKLIYTDREETIKFVKQ